MGLYFIPRVIKCGQFWGDQTMQIYGSFEGIPGKKEVHCLGW